MVDIEQATRCPNMHDEGEEAAREGRAQSNATRIAILRLLGRDEHGLTALQVRSVLPGGLTLRGVRYHLQVLEASDLIAEEDGRYKLA
jgi:predicted ArsR family transcriptional regulator